MIVRIKGIKTYRSKGKTYHYHRATGERLAAEPGTAAFIEEVARLDAKVKAQGELPGTLGALIAKYRASPKFAAKAERTKRDYQKVFDYLKPLSDVPLSRFTPPFVMKLRDKAFAKHKRRFADYVVDVLSLLFTWGKPYGITDGNPAADVPKMDKPRGTPEANRAWRDAELQTVLDRAPAELKTAIGLAAFAGLRQGDVLTLTWSAIRGDYIDTRQAKTGDPVCIRIHRELAAILATTPKHAVTVVTGQKGRPYTENGFRTVFFRFIRTLEEEGAVGEGLTFHGLRHTAGRMLADAGCDTRDIQAVLGHRTAAMSEHYAKEADTRRRASAAITKLEQARTKNV